MVRLTTRIAHSRAVVQTGQRRAQNPVNKSKEKAGWMLLPATARKLWAEHLAKQGQFLEYAENSPYNSLELNDKFTDFGIITAGLGWNYYMENRDELPVQPSHLHISVYPMPVEKIRQLADRVDRIVVIEEGFSFVERALLGILPPSVKISGKEDGALPRTGELTPDNVRGILGLDAKVGINASGGEIPGRPPQLCAGCPHRDSYDALNLALADFDQKLVTSDIGCYTLGYLPPYQAIETCLCMGASVGMAKGAAQAGFHPAVAVIGDSTFLHSGITPLVDAVASGANMTLLILDNSTTAMTGGQPTILTSARLEKLVLGLGVDPDHVKLIVPLKKHTEENTEIIRREIEHRGVSVIIALRDCIQTLKERKKKEAGQ
jgi:indolepyruvate ferredoxin oxidoreductase alpha subunit